MQVRRATSKDMLELNQLCVKIAGKGIDSFIGDTDSYYVLIKDNKFIGMACLEDYGHIEKDDIHIACHSYLLQNFGIVPSDRKQGHGTYFFRKLCKQLASYKNVCRIEWQIGGNTHSFWKHVTENKVQITRWCSGVECDEETCDYCQEVDSYHISFLSQMDFAVLLLSQSSK